MLVVFIKDGKIWIQYNGTEFDIAQELRDKGVPASDIVIGFHPPYIRSQTIYSAA